jgi:hypothetical protein
MELSSRRCTRRARLVIALSVSFIPIGVSHASATPIVLSENFDNVAGLNAAGWTFVNNSSPVGTTDWFQGNPAVFSAQSGAPDAYVAANFEAAGFGGNISDWLIAPMLTLNDGDRVSFYTRTEAGSAFPDRLELRLSTNGASANVGATDTSVGDFSTLLLSINPALAPGGYPENWAFFEIVLSGLGGPTDGRFAFRYNVADTSVNGDYIGIDTVTVTTVPEPSTLTLVSLGMLATRRRWSAARSRRS